MSARILLVEDDPVSSDLLASLLTSKGYLVDAASDGFGGLRLTQENAYDIVFVDYHLPEMDGYAFARLMRSLADKAERPLKMIAITADRFGLAARRGVDAVFDKLLTKPIDPDALYACVAALLPGAEAAAATSDIDDFLGEPTTDDAQFASEVLWRVRGMSTLPKAAVFPEPTAAERQGLSYCFKLVDPNDADCLVVLNETGLRDIAAWRLTGQRYLLPVFTVGESVFGTCDAAFVVGKPESWTLIASQIAEFSERAAQMRPEIVSANDTDLRLLAYLFVAQRPIVLQRDAFGRTNVMFSGGFASDWIIPAVRRLASRGMVASRPGETAQGVKELAIVLSGPGQNCVADVPVSAMQR